jgi:N-acetylglucosaminyldiphosphoundecaprenol N-acetyl-beta-D-mannosaminyltransferase
VLGCTVSLLDRTALIETILTTTRTTRKTYRVGYLNAAQINLGESDPGFGQLLRSMDLLYADGQSIIWAARQRGVRVPERLTAADFIGDFLRRAGTAGVSVAVLGGPAGAAESFASYWRAQAPELEIRWARDGYFSAEGESGVVASLEAADADVVLVGMGAPRQERFVERAAASGRPRVWWCVGALFEYGPWGRNRAPVWMQRAGLEWAYRLAQEPRRLAGRYLIGNPLFAWRVLTGKWG